MTRARRCLAVLTETREILIDPTEQFEIYKQLVQRRVADALAHSERGAMHLIGAGLNCCQRIDHTKPAILVAVPVETNAAALFLDDVFHKPHDSSRTVGC